MISALAAVAFASVVIGVVFIAAGVATRRWWSGRPHLAAVAGVLGVGAASLVVFLATWAHPVAGTVVSVAIVGASIIIAWRGATWTHWRRYLPFVVVTAGVGAAYLALLFLWQSPHEAFTLAQQRFFSGPLPTDNQLPEVFSMRLDAGLSTHHFVGDWNGSDRPPLQSGMILLVSAIAKPLSILGHSTVSGAAFGASAVAQMLWIPALLAALRSLGVSVRAALWGVLMVAATGTALVNTVYTWPKMLSAALVLCAVTLLMDGRSRPHMRRAGFAAAGVAVALAGLAHGGAAFALPLVAVMALYALRGSRPRRAVGAVTGAVVSGIVAFAPWWAYQAFADPPGNRLFKWHLAGVVDPTDGRSLIAALVDAYRGITWGDWVGGRVDNLATITGVGHLNTISCWCSSGAEELRANEFFITSAALSVGLPVLLVVGAILVSLIIRRRADDTAIALSLALGGSVASIAFWALLMFVPDSTYVHQGSQAWLLLLIGTPLAWLADSARRWALWLVVAQASFTALIYIPAPSPAPLDIVAVGVLILAVGAVVAAMRSTTLKDVNHAGAELLKQRIGPKV